MYRVKDILALLAPDTDALLYDRQCVVIQPERTPHPDPPLRLHPQENLQGQPVLRINLADRIFNILDRETEALDFFDGWASVSKGPCRR